MVSAGRSRLIPITRAFSHGTVWASARPIPPDAPEIHTREPTTDPNLLRTACRRLPGNHARPPGHHVIPKPVRLSRSGQLLLSPLSARLQPPAHQRRTGQALHPSEARRERVTRLREQQRVTGNAVASASHWYRRNHCYVDHDSGRRRGFRSPVPGGLRRWLQEGLIDGRRAATERNGGRVLMENRSDLAGREMRYGDPPVR